MDFVSLFSLNERNTATSLLMVNLKCTVVHFGSLNSSSINKPFLNYGPSNMLFPFFPFLFYVYFDEAFVKNFIKKQSFFNTNFQSSFQDVKIYFKVTEH